MGRRAPTSPRHEEARGRDGEINSPLQRTKTEERFLSAQADTFAGANAEEKVGLLRSVPQQHPGGKMRECKVMGDLDELARKWQQEDAHLRTKPEGGKVRAQRADVREGAHA